MEVKFQNKITPCITERFCETKKENLWLEAALPDGSGEVSEMLTLGAEVYLRGKDITANGVTVSAEAELSFLCSCGGELVSVSARKELTIEFDAPHTEGDWQATVSLFSHCASERIVNSHRVGGEVVIGCTVSCYSADSFTVSDGGAQQEKDGIHIKCRHEKYDLLSSVSEKPFVISEPLYPKNTGYAPEKIINSRIEYEDAGCQFIAEKMVIRGNARLSVLYLPERSTQPVYEEFILPFTQLVNVGREGLSCERVNIETTTAYINIGYAINGEKIIEAEIHALSQTVLSETAEADVVESAYSNIYHCSCITALSQTAEKTERETVNAREELRISTDEQISEIIYASVRNTPGLPVPQGELICIYKTDGGELRWTRKLFALSPPVYENAAAPERVRISSVSTRLENDGIIASAELSMEYVKRDKREITYAEALEIDTEEPIDFDSLPDIVLIRAGYEELWELAKEYHSTVEDITEINGTEIQPGELLLIPKAK